MPNPFPGVDPYLESQQYWEDFHNRFINAWSDVLADRVPDRYEVRLEERISLAAIPDAEAREIRPDVAILRGPSPRATPAGAGLLIPEPVDVTLETFPGEAVREVRIAIRRRPNRALVTVLELLSPSNKVAPGREDYTEKRLALIYQPVHLVELDLLVAGKRLPMAGPLPAGDHYALISRVERRPVSDVYAWSIREPLPTIPIPLQAPDPDIPIDLAAVFALTYLRGRYARSIDYDLPLALPLAPEDRAWAEGLARAAGEPR